VEGRRERNQQDATYLMFIIKRLSHHISGIIMPCPKHVEVYAKNKFEKLVHLVGFIIRMLKLNFIFIISLSEKQASLDISRA